MPWPVNTRQLAAGITSPHSRFHGSCTWPPHATVFKSKVMSTDFTFAINLSTLLAGMSKVTVPLVQGQLWKLVPCLMSKQSPRVGSWRPGWWIILLQADGKGGLCSIGRRSFATLLPMMICNGAFPGFLGVFFLKTAQ